MGRRRLDAVLVDEHVHARLPARPWLDPASAAREPRSTSFATTSPGDPSSVTHRSSRVKSSRASTAASSRSAPTSASAATGWSIACLSEQLADGGWNCEAERGSVRSSFHTTLCVLEGLLAFEQAFGATPAVTGARMRGEEYLLERRLLRRLSTGEIINPAWTQFAFPPLWHYDVLRALDYLRAASVRPDERVDEAVKILLERRQADGRWLLDVRHKTRRTKRWPVRSARQIAGSRCARSVCWIGALSRLNTPVA